MNVFRDLSGGMLIIIAAGVIAVAQNALRSDGIPLFPKAAPAVSGNPYTSDSSPAEDPSANAGPAGHRGSETPAARPSADEVASGVLTKERLQTLIAAGAVHVIDARLPAEFEAGHIEGAINIPYEKLPEYYEKLSAAVPLDAIVVCYCQSETCEDSENLAREMAFMGYTNVLRYKGGWDEWSLAGRPQTEPAQQD
jgi:rhodanese-related sulfurtransferase